MSEVKERSTRKTAASGKPSSTKVTKGQLVDKMFLIRDRRRDLENESKKLKEEYDALEAQLIDALKEDDSTQTDGKLATAKLSSVVVPDVQDWDLFYKFIFRHKYTHLLERRASVASCRELFDTKGSIPGVVPFVKVGINLRTKEQ